MACIVLPITSPVYDRLGHKSDPFGELSRLPGHATRFSQAGLMPGVVGAILSWPLAAARGADLPSKPVSKTASDVDWTGWYFGGSYGYSTGYSKLECEPSRRRWTDLARIP